MSRPIHIPQCENFSGFIIGATTNLYEVECLRERCMRWLECSQWLVEEKQNNYWVSK